MLSSPPPAPAPAAPDAASEAVPNGQASVNGNSSAGMGRRVASGGAWTMLGEVARFLAALVATHFTVLVLGKTSYGVWSLLTRITSSLSFSDAGVGVASTKYVSEAFARGDKEGERRALWTSLLAGFVPSLLVALLMLGLAPRVVHEFFGGVPEPLQGPMTLGLQIGAFAFVLRTISSVFNSPLLARMRLDLNTLISYGGIVAQIALVPLALKLGGLAWGTAVSLGVWIITGTIYTWLTARLLPGSLRPVLDRELLRPIVRMGIGTLVMALAAQALYSADAIIVGKLLKIEQAGYYNIAFQASTMLSILPAASAQALMPAFIRMLARGEHDELQALVRRAMRASCLVLPPVVALMCVAARPFFLHWASDPAYAANATPAFFCLIAGLALNVLMTVPFTLLMAMGRTDITARIGLFEVVPFVLYTWALTSVYGIVGAALGRSLRFAIASAIVFPLTARLSRVRFSPALRLAPLALALPGAVVPIGLACWPHVPLWAQFASAIAGVIFYAAVVHAGVLEPEERDIVARLAARLSRMLKK